MGEELYMSIEERISKKILIRIDFKKLEEVTRSYAKRIEELQEKRRKKNKLYEQLYKFDIERIKWGKDINELIFIFNRLDEKFAEDISKFRINDYSIRDLEKIDKSNKTKIKQKIEENVLYSEEKIKQIKKDLKWLEEHRHRLKLACKEYESYGLYAALIEALENALQYNINLIKTLKGKKINDVKQSNKPKEIEETKIVTRENKKNKEENKEESTLLIDLIKYTNDIRNRYVEYIFHAHDKNSELTFDYEEFVEYEKLYKKIRKQCRKYKDFKNTEIKSLREYVLKNKEFGDTIRSRFGEIALNSIISGNYFDINNLSPENLQKQINSDIKKKMKKLGRSHYSDVDDKMKVTDRYYREVEICNVTRFMTFDEIRMIYHDMNKGVVAEFERKNLQQNFAEAIYRRLVLNGYIKDDNKKRESVISQICTEILQDNKCKYADFENKEKLNLKSIINSKEYDTVKEMFDKKSSFGRIKEKIETKQKGNNNARKI